MSWHDDLKAYVDGELRPAEREEVERGLELEPLRRLEVESLREITNVLKTELERPEPVDATAGVEATQRALQAAKLTVETPPRRREPWFLKVVREPKVIAWGSLAACLVFAFFVKSGGVIGKPGGSDATPQEALKSKAVAPSFVGADAAAGGVKDFNASPEQGFAARSKGLPPSNGAMTGEVADGAIRSGGIANPANRVVARTAALGLSVRDAVEAQRRATSVLEAADAAISLSTVNVTPTQVLPEGTQPPAILAEANIEADVPSDHLDSVITQLSTLGKIEGQTVQATEVSRQLNDLSKERSALEKRFDDDSARIQGATRDRDKARWEELRSAAREQLRVIKEQEDSLKARVQMSHLSLRMTQPNPDMVGSGDTWGQARKSFGEFGRTVIDFLIFAVVWSPLWIPVGLIATYLSNRAKRQTP
jgi:anti-sigma factor RsiW